MQRKVLYTLETKQRNVKYLCRMYSVYIDFIYYVFTFQLYSP